MRASRAAKLGAQDIVERSVLQAGLKAFRSRKRTGPRERLAL